MPGPISDSYPGPPICKCGRFKRAHDWPEGTAAADVVFELEACYGYEEIPREESPFYQELDAFVLHHVQDEV